MKRPLSRVAMAILFSALLVVGAVLPAGADGPLYRVPLIPGSITLTDMCSFPVKATQDSGKVVATWWLKQGNDVLRGTGHWETTWTNLDTGYAVSVIESGIIEITTYPDGSQYILFAGKHGPPMAAPNWMLTGSQKVYITPEGVVTWTFNGNAEEVCAMLDH